MAYSPVNIPVDELRRLFLVENLTAPEIASRFGCKEKRVTHLLYKNHILKGDRVRDVEIGEKFGYLEVIGLNKKRRSSIECRCVCGNVRCFYRCDLLNGGHTSCRCMRGLSAAITRGFKYGGIYLGYWSSLKASAVARGWAFNVTMEYGWTLFVAQQGKCAISGVEIKFRENSYADQTASLDRIDSSKGYEEGNVQWVHKRVNRMKGNDSDNEFVLWCITIADHHRKGRGVTAEI